MYNVYVRDDDGVVMLAATDLTLSEALFRAEELFDRFREVIISETGHG